MRTITTPRDKQHWLELRAPNINSTEVAALFGCSPYLTEYELYHQKLAVKLASESGQPIPIVEIEQNDRMFIGSGLEEAIAKMAGQKLGVDTWPMKDYYALDESRIGASFDFCIKTRNPNSGKMEEGVDLGYREWIATALLEIKNVDYLQFRDKWIDHGKLDDDADDIEAPPHIELQVQTQLLVSGLEYAYICALVGGNDLKIIKRTADSDIQSEILARVAKFHTRVANQEAPPIDFSRDAEFVIALNQQVNPDSVLKIDECDYHTEVLELVNKYKDAADAAKRHEDEKQRYKAELLQIIGDHEKVKHPLFSISAGIIKETQVSYTRKSYRDFRVFVKKDGADE